MNEMTSALGVQRLNVVASTTQQRSIERCRLVTATHRLVWRLVQARPSHSAKFHHRIHIHQLKWLPHMLVERACQV